LEVRRKVTPWWSLEVKSKGESQIPVRYSLGFFITSLGFYNTSLGFFYPSLRPEPWTLASDLKKPRLRAASAQIVPWWSPEVKCKGEPQVPVRYSLGFFNTSLSFYNLSLGFFNTSLGFCNTSLGFCNLGLGLP